MRAVRYRLRDSIDIVRALLGRRGPLLNVGCGEYPARGWLNVDLHGRGPLPDLFASAAALPFPDKSLDAVYAGHFLEHLPLALVGDVLAEIRRTLRPGGRLCLVGPDLDRALHAFPEMVDTIQLGERRWAGDMHLWECRESLVVDLLRAAQFTEIAPVDVAALPSRLWPVTSRVGWQFAVYARAPAQPGRRRRRPGSTLPAWTVSR